MAKEVNFAMLSVQIVPRASKTEFAGWHGDAVKIRIQAPPADGKANLMLRGFIAESLGLPLAAVEIKSGETSRRKILRITGTTPENLAQVISSF